MSRNVHSFAQRGLIEKKPSPRDRRSTTLSITEQGKALLEELAAQVEANNRMLLKGLGRKRGANVQGHCQDDAGEHGRLRGDAVGLDPQSRIAMWEHLDDLNAKGVTTQVMEEADRLCLVLPAAASARSAFFAIFGLYNRFLQFL